MVDPPLSEGSFQLRLALLAKNIKTINLIYSITVALIQFFFQVPIILLFGSFSNYNFINQVGILKFIHFNFLNSHKNSFYLIIPLRFFKHYFIKSNPIDFNYYYDFLNFKVLFTNIMALNQVVMVIFLLCFLHINHFKSFYY
jgi:hypothetical protein